MEAKSYKSNIQDFFDPYLTVKPLMVPARLPAIVKVYNAWKH
jgi:hypothetical protein